MAEEPEGAPAIPPATGAERALSDILKAISTSASAERRTWQASMGGMLIEKHLDSLKTDFVALIRGSRVSHVDTTRRDMIVSLFYGLIDDTYVGVDSHLPSEFFQAYPTLLQHLHAGNEDRDAAGPSGQDCYRTRAVRVVPRNRDDIETDVRDNPRAWERYTARHQKLGIELLQVEERFARNSLKEWIEEPERWTMNLGVWIHTCALLFSEPSGEDTRELQLLRLGDFPWSEYIKYISDLVGEASVMSRTQDGMVDFEEMDVELREDIQWSLESMFDEPNLAARWGEFVNPKRRIENGLGSVLEDLLESAKSLRKTSNRNLNVLDAAAGVGPESIWLLEKHSKWIRVVSNEIDWALADQCRRNASDASVDLNITQYDWRHIAKKLREDEIGEEFDVILALGNSLTCVLDVKEMRRCLENFYELLAPGGYLLVDERNFRKLLDGDRFNVRSGFVPSDIVYCGDIRAKVDPDHPGSLGRKAMRLAYYEPGKSARSRPIGYFTVFPFSRGQVRGLLKEAGFVVTECLSDLRKEQNADAWFFTYLARKPSDTEEIQEVVGASKKIASVERAKDSEI